LIQEIDGTIWSKMLPRNQTAQYKEKFNVISERLVVGQTQIFVQSEFQPEIGFELAPTNLEDVYFATLKKFEQGAQHAQ
jgi:ABC-2 type transport system ATP-binding protein